MNPSVNVGQNAVMNYLHIGQNELLRGESVVGVFDLDHCTVSKRGREFLQRADADGLVIDPSGLLPRSFVVTTHPYHPQIVRLSPLSTAAIIRHSEPWDASE